MSETLVRIRLLVGRGDVATSVHGFRELAADDILLDDVTAGVTTAIVVEEYPEAFKGPSVLVLQRDRDGKALHIVWAFQKAPMARRRSSPRTAQSPTAGRATS